MLAVATGFALTLLLLVKWPSAFCISAGIAAFIILSGRRKQLAAFLGCAFGGGFVALLLAQLVVGNIVYRMRTLASASSTLLEGQNFLDAYVWIYVRNIGRTANHVFVIGGPLLIPFFIASMLLVRRRPTLAGYVYSFGIVALVVRARLASYLTGGEINVIQLESTFPIFFVGTLGVGLMLAYSTAKTSKGWVKASGDSIVKISADPKSKSLVVGLILLTLTPLLQAIGTGNPMFRIAFCAGGAWSASMAVLMVIAIERGGIPFVVPAATCVATACIIGLFPGLQGLWTDSFRVGPLWNETVASPGVPELKGLNLDPTTADLISKTREILVREGALGKPGFSTSNGTGLTYAVGLAQPLAGLFVEEPLPDVLRACIAEACELDLIKPDKPPVVLSLGDGPPKVATESLQLCGVKFPSEYRSFRVKPIAGGFVYMRDEGITVWIPNWITAPK